MWSDGGSGSGHLQAARFRTQSNAMPSRFHRAVAAPGMEQFAQNNAPPQPPPQKRRFWRDLPGVVAALPEPLSRAGELP
jgi:hypothetical protein